jgi:pantoate--beta-alanine ligase
MTAEPPVALVRSINELRQRVAVWRGRGERIGLVPTMGALHAGHASLVEEARRRANRVVATVFVNPTQFGPCEDLAKYPRTLDADLQKLAAAGADLCFAPPVDEIYPQGFCTRIEMDGPAKADLEDRFRPTHFSGVATVVAKLLNQARPDVAVFGEKDYQQLLVIRRLEADLDLGVEIAGAPTLREADGLAMSSRNVYLSPQERKIAPVLYGALATAAKRIAGGEALSHCVASAREEVEAAGFVVDYLEARNAETLARAIRSEGPLRLLAAAKLGTTRLIDNLAV